jgi:UDP-N-acetylglucosamine 2-epimerase (non-hydrolysing)
MIAYEKVARQARPDWIVVVGDVNSTAACAMVGAKLWIPVVHLEAGLRSGDRRMPEEINRLVTDAICELLWTPSPDADDNLRREGVPAARIERVGNIMLDSYEMMRPAIEADGTRAAFGLEPGRYAVVTLHRPSNVDQLESLEPLVAQLLAVAERLPLVFAVHPRTRQRLADFGLLERLLAAPQVRLCEPLGYLQFMNLVRTAAAMITDSGGVQEESTYLGIPCLTLRENTERPITVSEGTNRLVPPARLRESVDEVLAGHWPTGRRPERWDGQTAGRCVASLRRHAGV